VVKHFFADNSRVIVGPSPNNRVELSDESLLWGCFIGSDGFPNSLNMVSNLTLARLDDELEP
jgi:hypothetical protein